MCVLVGIGVAAAIALPGCDAFCVDPLHWLIGMDFYPIADGQAYRSRQPDAVLLEHVIKDLGVRTVINLRGENAGEPWYDAEVERVAELGATLVDIPMSASHPPSSEVLLQLYEAFLTVDHPILIHCKGGADRTGAASAIWRMTVAGDSRQDALSELDCRYGHFRQYTPAMDWLAEVFVPDANWITTQYDPNAFYSPQVSGTRGG